MDLGRLWPAREGRRDGCFHRFVSEILLAAARGMLPALLRHPERSQENLRQSHAYGWGPFNHSCPAVLGARTAWVGRGTQPPSLSHYTEI